MSEIEGERAFWEEKLRQSPDTAKALVRHYEDKARLCPPGSSWARRYAEMADSHRRDLAQPTPTTPNARDEG